MKKLFLTVALLFSILNFGTANAEQPKAEEYRQMFQSGNYYIEFKFKYQDKWLTRILAAKDGERMERMSHKYERDKMAWLNPLGAMFGGGENKNPEVMYSKGYYFQFVGKNKANYCHENDINHENINPRSGWDKVSKKLELPDELAVLYWNKNSEIPAPTFTKSFKKTLKVKDKEIEYDCDQYTCEINGDKNSGNLFYELLYNDKGELFQAESYLVRNNQKYQINIVEIDTIQSEIPENTFQINEAEIQVYKPAKGDMADLLEKPTHFGTMKELLNPKTVETAKE